MAALMAAAIEHVRVPAYRRGGAAVYLADAREVVVRLPDHSIDCCVTSPPYWGFSDRHLPPVALGGDPDCRHRRSCPGRDQCRASPLNPAGLLATAALRGSATGDRSRFCLLCGAWLASLGLEPTPELYVEHLVDVFRQLRRVLKPTGTLWLNLRARTAERKAGTDVVNTTPPSGGSTSEGES